MSLYSSILIFLIENGANVNIADNNGVTPLMFAAKNIDALRVLIENGASVNAADNNGKTPMMFVAAGNSTPETLLFLIEKGADANAIDQDGNTPLILAASSNSLNTDILRILIEKGADASIKDKQGGIALDYVEKGLSNLRNSDLLNLHDGKIRKTHTGTRVDRVAGGQFRDVKVADNANLDLYHPWNRKSPQIFIGVYHLESLRPKASIIER
jgi:hypothetical protein